MNRRAEPSLCQIQLIGTAEILVQRAILQVLRSRLILRPPAIRKDGGACVREAIGIVVPQGPKGSSREPRDQEQPA